MTRYHHHLNFKGIFPVNYVLPVTHCTLFFHVFWRRILSKNLKRIFTRCLPFVLPNQQYQSTEDIMLLTQNMLLCFYSHTYLLTCYAITLGFSEKAFFSIEFLRIGLNPLKKNF